MLSVPHATPSERRHANQREPGMPIFSLAPSSTSNDDSVSSYPKCSWTTLRLRLDLPCAFCLTVIEGWLIVSLAKGRVVWCVACLSGCETLSVLTPCLRPKIRTRAHRSGAVPLFHLKRKLDPWRLAMPSHGFSVPPLLAPKRQARRRRHCVSSVEDESIFLPSTLSLSRAFASSGS